LINQSYIYLINRRSLLPYDIKKYNIEQSYKGMKRELHLCGELFLDIIGISEM